MQLDDYETRISFLDQVQFSFELEFSKTLLLLSSGAFGLSLVFVDALEALAPSNVRSLKVAWACFGYASLAVLLLLLIAQYAVKREGAKLEAYHRGDESTKRLFEAVFSPSTKWFQKLWIAFRINKPLGALYFLRWSSLVAFIVGVPFLASFALSNLSYNSDPALTPREAALVHSLRVERERFQASGDSLRLLRIELGHLLVDSTDS